MEQPILSDDVSQQHPESQAGFAPRRQYDSGVNRKNVDASEVYMESASNGLGQTITAILTNPIHQQQAAAVSDATETNVKPQKNRQAKGKKAEKKASVAELIKSVAQTDNSAQTNNGDNMGVTKTPVSILQEMLSRRGITPGYELVQIEGAIHEPTFRYRVSFIDKDVPYTAMGVGRSKKEAKHSAARALMDKLLGNMPSTQCEMAEPVSVAGTSGVSNVVGSNAIEQGSGGDGNDKVVGNPIGWLQEMCMSRRWPPPTYETEKEVGLPHERLFTIACTILNYREVGKGKSKKIAKRLAAHNMWNRLKENPIEYDQILENLQGTNDTENRNCVNFYGDLKNANVPTITSQHSAKVSQFHKQLKNATGKKLLKLQTTCLNEKDVDFQTILQEIAAENKFEVTFVDIDEKTFDDKFQCLVQLSTLPVGVCHGTGINQEDAQSKAAMNALQYLKIMTKK